MPESVSICVIGSGYVGLVAAACFAEMGHCVLCVDNDEARVKNLRDGGVPIFEDHLPELLARHRGKGVGFTTDLGSAVEASEAIFIAVALPRETRAPPIFLSSRLWSPGLPATLTATK